MLKHLLMMLKHFWMGSSMSAHMLASVYMTEKLPWSICSWIFCTTLR